jgi:dTDP-4-amino-4,6-dideoxy-D-galactose acyltransferase
MKRDSTADVLSGCQVLTWDSEFFGRRIARVEPVTIVTAGTTAVDEWCASQKVECVYLLVDANDQTTTDVAQSGGFRLVDVRLTLETVGAPISSSVTEDRGPLVRLATRDDLPALRAIARTCHRDTRFYTDGHFDRQRCDDLYDLWIEKSYGGWADRVFVADDDGTAVGYTTCHLGPHEGRIGLVGVSAESRGQGSGRTMMREARKWFAEQGVERISVVTQGRNSSGLRLYQRAGMVVRTVQLWFHKWL